MHIFFKPSDFEYKCNILDIDEYLFSKTIDKKGGSKKDGSKKEGSKKDDKSSTGKGKNARSPIEKSQRSCGCFYISKTNFNF